jgi:hypothetical protein
MDTFTRNSMERSVNWTSPDPRTTILFNWSEEGKHKIVQTHLFSQKRTSGKMRRLRTNPQTSEKVNITNVWIFCLNLQAHSRSQRPRGLRHELSSLARTLGSRVRIPLKERISICVYSVYVFLFRYRPFVGLIPRPRSPTGCLKLRN